MNRLKLLSPGLLALAMAGQANAVVFSQSATSAAASVFSGVANISIAGSGSCSGTLLGDGLHVLTAGHCAVNQAIGAFSVNFQYDAGGGSTASQSLGVSSYLLAPAWDTASSVTANLLNGADLAILTLSAMANIGITRYAINEGTTNLAGAAAQIVGYGQSGVASNSLDTGTRRVADNTVAGYWSSSTGPCVNSGIGSSGASKQLCTQLNNGPTNTGIGAFGDSGGGLFVNNVLVGVNSFVVCAPGTVSCSYANPNAIGFGAMAGATNVAAYASFIDGILGVTAPAPGGGVATPEPSSLLLACAGLLLAVWKRQ